ncbi:MAG: hypothetical protein WDO24_28205 [Pseudomonadota bacterium]
MFRKFAKILEAAGASFDNIVETTDYFLTFDDYDKTAQVRPGRRADPRARADRDQGDRGARRAARVEDRRQTTDLSFSSVLCRLSSVVARAWPVLAPTSAARARARARYRLG